MKSDFGFSEDEIKEFTKGAAKMQRTMFWSMLKTMWPMMLVSAVLSIGVLGGAIILVIYLVKHL